MSGVATTRAISLMGVEGQLVDVEADLALGLPSLSIVGLPDTALAEARDRVRAAVVNSGEAWPSRRITLALLPATLPKAGSMFDLALAVAVLAAAGVVPRSRLPDILMLGELGLDGRVRPVRGVLPAVLAGVRAGLDWVVVPVDNATEARLVPSVNVVAVSSLRGLLRWLRTGVLEECLPPALPAGTGSPGSAGGLEPALQREALQGEALQGEAALDMAQVGGQWAGRRAMEVAAAGGHHVFLLGPPGAGKTMLAERLPGLLPRLPFDWALEVSAIHSVAGLLAPGHPLVELPPFRAPHHGSTLAALVGGGSGTLRPGEVSCAHRGVLFLDEAPEFSAGVLDALRQPLESGVIEISRARGSARFPARITLVMAANRCPCARSNGGDDLACTCPPPVRRRYLAKLSGPLLDRVDLRVSVPRVTRAELLADAAFLESSAVIAARVGAARAAATARLSGTPWRTNAEIPGHELRRRWPLSANQLRRILALLDTGLITARGVDRVARVAWTLADLAGLASPTDTEVDEAIGLRLARAA